MGQRTYRPGDEPVSGYHLQQFLGRGGFGEVWKAIGPGGVHTAVKIIHDLDRKRGGKELRALRLLRDIRHPNLVPLTAFWLRSDDGELIRDDSDWEEDSSAAWSDANTATPVELGPRGTLLALPARREAIATLPQPAELVIAMGLAEKSLFDRLRECREAGQPGVELNELLTYMEDAARAIDVLNTRHEIQHCDIKPQNILLLSGAAQVCDFGLAKMIGEVRETSMGAGTIAYGAPEVLLGKGPTPSTDQYSLAISYFELRTGELPFGGERISDVLNAKQYGSIDLKMLPAGERAVIAKAASIEPSERFASCMELVRALRTCGGDNLVGSLPIRPAALVETQRYRTTAAEQDWRQSQRTPWISAAVVAGLAAIIGLAVTVGWLFRQSLCSEKSAGPLANSTPVTTNSSIAGAPAAPTSSPADHAAHSGDLTAEQELAKADRVLAEADATLSAAKAALAASHAIPANQVPNVGAASLEKVASATQTAAINTQVIADSSRQTARNTQSIAESSKEMVLSLDKLREQLANISQRGGIVESPTTPSDFYHNARTYEEHGDLLNARKSYLQLFTFQLQVVDPYVHFVSLLRLQEGRAGARETFSDIAQDPDDVITRFAMLLLEPEETRESQWSEFAAKHPEFSPAIYEWSREYSRERLGAQGLADMAKEKQLLEQFARLAEEGKLKRYYFDQSFAVKTLEEANTRLVALQHFDQQTLDHPVQISAMPSGSSWTVMLTVAEVTREILYRFEEDDQFQSTGFTGGIDQRSGARIPNPSFQLPLDAEAKKLFVKYRDIRDREQGPFELKFDPHAEQCAFGQQTLEGFPHSWVMIRDYDGRLLAYFTHLISYRAAIREIRGRH